jgi:hypothetical protein
MYCILVLLARGSAGSKVSAEVLQREWKMASDLECISTMDSLLVYLRLSWIERSLQTFQGPIAATFSFVADESWPTRDFAPVFHSPRVSLSCRTKSRPSDNFAWNFHPSTRARQAGDYRLLSPPVASHWCETDFATSDGTF